MSGKRFMTLIVAAILVLALGNAARATNGDNLISVGPISRSMGGVGIASPQDAVSAVFANPAAMCFGPYCPSSRLDASVDLFIPSVSTKVTNSFGTFSADSDYRVYPLPAIGYSTPIIEQDPQLRFGIAAYGVTGLGVNYRGTDVDQSDSAFGMTIPRAAGTFTQLQQAKLAPALAYQPLDWLSLGASFHLQYGSLDLGAGAKTGWAVGIQPGIIVKPLDWLSFGATYISPQKIKYNNVADFEGDGEYDSLELEAPQQFGVGVAVEPILGKLLVETDVKFINWSQAQGYDDFDWQDQWVFNIGVQYKALDWVTLRAGYNFAENPVKSHGGFVGSDLIDVQGHLMPTYYYESFRIVGFPAIVENHITFGLGLAPTDNFTIELSYMYALQKTMREEGTDLFGGPAAFESTLNENSFGVGISYTF